MNYAPGLHQLTREQYDTATGIRNTEVSWAAKSLANYAHNLSNGTKETDPKRDGQLIHRAILEPDVFDATTVIIPSDAPKYPSKTQLGAKKPSPETVENIAWWKEFGIKNAGKTIIDKDDYQIIQDISGAVLNDECASEILSRCKRREIAVFSRHEATGLILKSQIDLLSDDSTEIWDIKTAVDSEPEEYRRVVAKRGYHRQAAYYPDHFPRIGMKTPSFGHIIVEKQAPYIVSVRPFEEDSIEIGRREYRTLLHKIATAKQTGRYPGYHNGREETGLTLWKLKEVLG